METSILRTAGPPRAAMTDDVGTSSIAGTKRWQLDRPAQYASDEVPAPRLAVSHGFRHRDVGSVIAGHFSGIFGVRPAVNRGSVMASHNHANVKTDHLVRIRRVVF